MGKTYFNKLSLLAAVVCGGLFGAAAAQRFVVDEPGELSPLILLGAASWIGLISLVTFVTFVLDKAKAKRSSPRISENTLLWLTALGGVLGAIAGMVLVRHKTRKGPFLLRFCSVTFLETVGLAAGAYLAFRMLGGS